MALFKQERDSEKPKFEAKSASLWENCDFPSNWDQHYTHVAFRKDRRISREWCIASVDQIDSIRKLGNLMQLVTKSENHDVLVAANFGVFKRIMFSKHANELFVNPTMKPISTQVTNCTDAIIDPASPGKQIIIEHRGRYREITVSYIDIMDQHLSKKMWTFTGKKSCAIQSGFDEMNNENIDVARTVTGVI